jgi:hypothetical protein
MVYDHNGKTRANTQDFVLEMWSIDKGVKFTNQRNDDKAVQMIDDYDDKAHHKEASDQDTKGGDTNPWVEPTIIPQNTD